MKVVEQRGALFGKKEPGQIVMTWTRVPQTTRSLRTAVSLTRVKNGPRISSRISWKRV